MDVDRARADRAATGQRHIRVAVARHQRSQHQDGRTHGLHQLVRREALAHGGGIDLDAHALVDGDGRAHSAEQLDGRRDIAQVRHVRHHDRILREQCPGEYRQGGVLGAGDAHLALEGNTTLDLQLVHVSAARTLRG